MRVRACTRVHTVPRPSLSVRLRQPPPCFVPVRVYVCGVCLLSLQCSQGDVYMPRSRCNKNLANRWEGNAGNVGEAGR